MTRAELRAVIQDFRDMIRARGPRECLEVASVRPAEASMTLWERHIFRERQLFFSRAALRWWRWANRDWRFVTVSEPSLHGPGFYVRWYSENR